MPLPGTIAQNPANSNILDFTGINAGIEGTYNLVIKAWDTLYQYNCNSYIISLIVNNLPTKIATFASTTFARVPYTNNGNIAEAWYWFIDADGDTLTVNISSW